MSPVKPTAAPGSSAARLPGPAPIAAPPLALSRNELQVRLSEAEETLRAIRSGEVDALVVRDASLDTQVFTLSSADRPYRMFVENMRDGAATLSDTGLILYANMRFAELTGRALADLIGSPIAGLLNDAGRVALRAVSGRSGGTADLDLIASGSVPVPVRVNTSMLDVDGQLVLCVTLADLSYQNAQNREIDRLQAERLRELELNEHALTEQATHDALTGLANRTLLIDRITKALAVSARSGASVGLIFVDLDRFKDINDTRGHAAGDAVLRQVASRLQTAVRPMDSVCRLGGDEFVVLLPALAGLGDAAAVAARITAGIEGPIQLDHGSVLVTASIGMTLAAPSATPGDISAEGLIQCADAAMYHSKSLGGSQSQLFASGITPTVFKADRETWLARIHDALENDRFVLLAQPIIDLKTGATVQHELLLRMRDRDEHLIAPLAFLPTAERCGLVGAIDQWVISRSAQLARLGQHVAVNLSAVSAGDPVVLDRIEQEFGRHDMDPGMIVFEITETAVMQNLDRGMLFAERMVALGCRFALDDFGTGFASFTYLKRLPVQYLKIDIDFVRDVVHSQRDRAVVSAIVGLAAGFGQETIAEGVEDGQTAEILRDLGVTYAQGYLYGRPAAIPEDQRLRPARQPVSQD